MRYDVGTEIGGYQLEKLCGTGAYGMVFVAENVLTGKKFALKIIPKIGSSWERELNALIRYKDCTHQNLMQIHHIAQTEDAIYYVMDLADNSGSSWETYVPRTLANRIHEEGRISTEELTVIVEQLLDGIDALHRHHLLHRDIKPDNILWISGRVVLGDIGLLSTQQTASIAGTVGFLSEELLKGIRTANEADDFYALGKVVYCGLTGNSPKDYPDYPTELPLVENTGLIAVSIAACQQPYIQTAKEFLETMRLPTAVRRATKTSVWLYPLGIAVIVLIVFGVMVMVHGVLKTGNAKETHRGNPVIRQEKIPSEKTFLSQNDNVSTVNGIAYPGGKFREKALNMRSDFERQKENMQK